MMHSNKKVIVVAPHPDDETLGCGGTLLRHIADGDEVHWLIVTSIDELTMFSEERKTSRRAEIEAVTAAYGFHKTHKLAFDSMSLDTISKGKVIGAISQIFNDVEPDTVYLPYRLDAHSDHEVVFDAAVACCKSFRYPFVKTVRAYATRSETEFGMRPEDSGFRPNCFVDVSAYMLKKVDIMALFEGEMGEHPFPRSRECLLAEGTLNGSIAGCQYAESFMTLREIL